MDTKYRIILSFFFGVIISAIILATGINIIENNIFLIAILVIGLIIAFCVILWAINFYKEEIISFIFSKLRQEKNRISKDVNQIVNGLNENNNSKVANGIKGTFDTINNYYLKAQYRRFIIHSLQALFILFGGILGSVMISNQNLLFEKQNSLLEKQMIRLDQQTYLQEAERRSALVFLFSNIMDLLDKELKDDYKADGIRNISPQLQARIISLSQRLKPYRFLEGDKLSKKEYSPERAQLFVNLTKSDLDSTSLNSIIGEGNFTYSDFSGISFNNLKLENVDLSNSRFSNVIFINSILERVDLKNTIFKNVEIDSLIIQNSFYSNCSMEIKNKLNLYFDNVNIQDCQIKATNSYYSGGGKIIYENSDLENSVFEGNIDKLNFSRSKLSNVEFICKTEKLNFNKSFIWIDDNWERKYKKLTPYQQQIQKSNIKLVTKRLDVVNLNTIDYLNSICNFTSPKDTIIEFGQYKTYEPETFDDIYSPIYLILNRDSILDELYDSPKEFYALSLKLDDYYFTFDGLRNFMKSFFGYSIWQGLTILNEEFDRKKYGDDYLEYRKTITTKSRELFKPSKHRYPDLYWETYIDEFKWRIMDFVDNNNLIDIMEEKTRMDSIQNLMNSDDYYLKEDHNYLANDYLDFTIKFVDEHSDTTNYPRIRKIFSK